MKVFLLVCLTVLIYGCGFPSVDPGNEGVMVKKPFIFGSGGINDNPYKPGRYFTAITTSIVEYNMRPQVFTEKFNILMIDSKLNISFDVYLKLRIKENKTPDMLKTIGRPVEDDNKKNWYTTVIQPDFRAAVREVISTYKTDEANNNRAEMSQKIEDIMKQRITKNDAPIDVLKVNISNIDYPDSITQAVELKMQKEQELKRLNYEVKIEQKKAVKRIEEARGIAKANNIINQSLTPTYLQYEYIKAIKDSDQKGNKIIYIPIGKQGLPIVHTQ